MKKAILYFFREITPFLYSICLLFHIYTIQKMVRLFFYIKRNLRAIRYRVLPFGNSSSSFLLIPLSMRSSAP